MSYRVPTALEGLPMDTSLSRYLELGFLPAYLDFDTQKTYLPRFPDGRLAPSHALDGLPDELVIDRTMSNRAIAIKASVIKGFVRRGFFYTGAAAARAVAEWTDGGNAVVPGVTEDAS